jgi:hypothetical protein
MISAPTSSMLGFADDRDPPLIVRSELPPKASTVWSIDCCRCRRPLSKRWLWTAVSRVRGADAEEPYRQQILRQTVVENRLGRYPDRIAPVADLWQRPRSAEPALDSQLAPNHGRSPRGLFSLPGRERMLGRHALVIRAQANSELRRKTQS